MQIAPTRCEWGLNKFGHDIAVWIGFDLDKQKQCMLNDNGDYQLSTINKNRSI